MDSWLSNGLNYVICNDREDCPGYATTMSTDDDKRLFVILLEHYSEITDPADPLNNVTEYQTYVGYNSEPVVYAGNDIPAGWHVLKINTITASGEESYDYEATPITEKSEFYFKFNGYTDRYVDTITRYGHGLDDINGKIIGVIEGEPEQYFNFTITVNNGTYNIGTIATVNDKVEKYGQVTVQNITPNAGYTGPAVNSAIVTNCTVMNQYPPLGPTINEISLCKFTGDVTITLDCIQGT